MLTKLKQNYENLQFKGIIVGGKSKSLWFSVRQSGWYFDIESNGFIVEFTLRYRVAEFCGCRCGQWVRREHFQQHGYHT